MLDWLEQLFNSKPDSSAQLEKAKQDARHYSPEQDRLARSRGFKNADAMIQFERQKSTRRTSQTTGAQSAVQQGVDTVKTAHPAGVLERVTAALQQAGGRK